MAEFLKENESPLNQAAKKVLKNPKPDLLYCLQAADLAVSRGVVELDRQTKYQLLENLNELMSLWSPENAMKFLEGPDEENLVNNLPKARNLKSVAWAVLDQLDSRLSAELIGYPRSRELPANFR